MTTIFYEALPVAHLTFEDEWRLDYKATWEARRLAFPCVDTPGSARNFLERLSVRSDAVMCQASIRAAVQCRGPVWRCEGQVHISVAGAKPFGNAWFS